MINEIGAAYSIQPQQQTWSPVTYNQSNASLGNYSGSNLYGVSQDNGVDLETAILDLLHHLIASLQNSRGSEAAAQQALPQLPNLGNAGQGSAQQALSPNVQQNDIPDLPPLAGSAEQLDQAQVENQLLENILLQNALVQGTFLQGAISQTGSQTL